MTQTQQNPLGHAPLGPLIAKFAIPSIISMLVSAAYNITDQIFIGHTVGMLGNAATNVAFPVVSLCTALSQLSGVGTAANFNLSLGRGEEEEARRYLGTGLCFMSVLGLVLFAVVALLKTPILLLFGATETVLPYARDYLGITMLGLPFLLFTNAGSAIIRADRSPTYSMLCTVSGAVLNIFLDWLFMGVLRWGVKGAALATVIGQLVSFALCLAYFPRFKTFPIRASMLRLRADYVLRIMKLGATGFINHIMMGSVNVVLNNVLGHYGALSVYGSDIPLAVSGVVAKLTSILNALMVGLALGCQPIWSFNMGAKNYTRVKAAYRRVAGMALLFSFLAFVCFQLFPRPITGIFGSGDELYFRFAEQYLRIYMMMVCLVGLQPSTVNFFTSIGRVKQGVFLSLTRQGLLLLPLLVLLPRFWGLNGVLIAGPAADVLAFLLSLTLAASFFRHLEKEG